MAIQALREQSYYVLAALLDGPQHGYGIIKQARRLTGGEVVLPPGTLYGALERLADAGLIIAAGEEVVDGRVRRYFRLSETGHATLLHEATRLEAAAKLVLGRVAAGVG